MCCQYICRVLATSEAATDADSVNYPQFVANIYGGYIGKPIVVPQTHPRTLKRYLKPEGPWRTRVLGIVAYQTQYVAHPTQYPVTYFQVLPIYYWQDIGNTVTGLLPIGYWQDIGNQEEDLRRTRVLVANILLAKYWQGYSRHVAHNTWGYGIPHVLTWVLSFYCVLGFHATYWRWGVYCVLMGPWTN